MAVSYTGREWMLELPEGTRLLNSNERPHWAARAAVTAELRATAGWLARAQRVPPLQWAHVLYFVGARGRYDPGNWYPTAKAGIDGIVDAGVLRDDSRKYLLGPDPRVRGRRGFSLLIRELAEAPQD